MFGQINGCNCKIFIKQEKVVVKDKSGGYTKVRTKFICIPFRSEISHSYAYHFKKSKRSQKHKSVKETMVRLDKIKYEALKFVEDYVAHLNKTRELDDREFKRRYTYLSLQYFS